MQNQANSYAPPLDTTPPSSIDVLVGAGFWRRVAAYLVDGLILGAASFLLSFLFLSASPSDSIMALSKVIGFLIGVAYFAFQESSVWQATIGKRILGMRVVDVDGFQLTPMRAIARYISAGLNWLLLGFGYLVVAFHPEKRGLHDMIAQTRVVLEDPNDTKTPMLAWIIIGVYAFLGLLSLGALVMILLALSGTGA